MDYSYLLGLGELPTFRLYDELSGVDNLDPNLTINSTTVTPTFRYKGGDADGTNWAAWGYGETIPRVSVATPPTYNDGSPGLGPNDDSALFNHSDYYALNPSSTNQFTTGDIAVECILKNVWESDVIWSTYVSQGVVMYLGVDGKLRFWIHDGSGSTQAISAAASEGAWIHVMVFINRDEASTNGGQIYINGVASGSGVDFSARQNSLVETKFSLGAYPDGTLPFTGNLAYVAAWEQASWHQAGASGPAEWATIAAERFIRLTGHYPQIAKGTALPTVKTRAFPAYLRKYEGSATKLYYVGGEWLRMEHLQDSGAVDVYGYLPETQAENLIVESEDIATTWAKIDAGDVLDATATACPDGRSVAGSVAGDSTDGQHGVEISPTLTANTYTFSVYAKPGNKDWVYLNNSTVANCYCYFDVTNGTVGTSGAGATGYMEGPFTGGFYRCCIVFTGTAAAHTLQLSPAHADTDNDFAGDGSTKNSYFWGAQCELGDYMTSPIITTGASATRLADQLRFEAGANIGGEDVGTGTVVFDLLLSDYANNSSLHCFSIDDGGALGDRIFGQIASNENWTVDTRSSSGNNGDASVVGDGADGVVHSCRLTWSTDNLVPYYDGSPGTPDTDCAMPDDLDRLNIGMNYASVGQTKGIISNIRIYNKPTTSG